MFYNRGEVISDQFDHFQVIGFGVLVGKIWKKRAKTKLFGSFSLKGGGGPLFPNEYVRILTKSEHFCEHQKCFLGPKMQYKPQTNFWTEASQIIPYFFLRGSLTYICLFNASRIIILADSKAFPRGGGLKRKYSTNSEFPF